MMVSDIDERMTIDELVGWSQYICHQSDAPALPAKPALQNVARLLESQGIPLKG